MIYDFFGIKTNYIVLKSKQKTTQTPLLFLHGWGGGINSFLYFAKFAFDRDCILIDFAPFGASGEVTFPLSTKLYAKIVMGILNSLKVSKVGIVAHSFGGRVAIELNKVGLKIDKMLLTGCAGIKKKSFVKQIKIARYKFVKLLCKMRLINKKRLQKFGSSDYKNLSPVMKATFNNIVNYDQTNDLKKIFCPVLLFWGKNDKETPFYFTKIFKKHIKDCGVVSTNGGHFAYLQSPSLFLNVMSIFFEIKKGI